MPGGYTRRGKRRVKNLPWEWSAEIHARVFQMRRRQRPLSRDEFTKLRVSALKAIRDKSPKRLAQCPRSAEIFVKQPTHRSRPTTWGLIRSALRTLFLLYLTMAAGCTAFQRKMIYYPTVAAPGALDGFAKSKGLERWNTAAGQEIGWKRAALTQPPLGRVLITHGNGCCAIQRLDFANPLRESAGMEVFILEYPGFGDRPGAPSEAAMYAAAEEGFQALPKTAPVYLIGESLGTGVAAHLAGAHPEVVGVLLFAPFNSLVDVAQHHLKILPASWLMRERFESEKYLRRYRGPLAIIVGGKDQVIPEKFGRRLFDNYEGPKRLWQAPLASHNEVHAQSAEYWNEIIAFWQMHATVRTFTTSGVDAKGSANFGGNSLVAEAGSCLGGYFPHPPAVPETSAPVQMRRWLSGASRAWTSCAYCN